MRARFRMGNEVLAFRFTATSSDRASAAPRERLDAPDSLVAWLRLAGLEVPAATDEGLARARALRETIYRIGAALAGGLAPRPEDVAALNEASTAGRPRLLLAPDDLLAAWRLGDDAPLVDAMSVIAADAIRVFGGAAAGAIKTCEGPGCAGLFLDASRGANRRWCSMNTCGNRVKKSRRAAH